MQGLAATSSILPGVLGVFEAVTQNEMLAITFRFAKLTLQGHGWRHPLRRQKSGHNALKPRSMNSYTSPSDLT